VDFCLEVLVFVVKIGFLVKVDKKSSQFVIIFCFYLVLENLLFIGRFGVIQKFWAAVYISGF